MDGEVPDHPAGAGPVRELRCLALEIEEADDRSVRLRDQLDRGPLVVLLLPLDRIPEGRAEEGEDPAAHPADLVRRLVGAHREHGATS